MKKEYKILIIISLIYFAGLFLFLAEFNFNPSATIILGEKYFFELQSKGYELPSGLIIHENRGYNGYDGQHYYLMAKNIIGICKLGDYGWCQRIFYPLLSRILSFGFDNLLPLIMLLINFVSLVASVYVLLLVLKEYGANLNLVYLWAFCVGLVISITRDLTEPLLFFFLILAIYFIIKNKINFTALFLCLAVLTKETAIVVILPMLLFFILKKQWQKTVWLSIPLIVLVYWQIILFFSYGAVPLLQIGSQISWPLAGLYQYLVDFKLERDLMPLSYLPLIFSFIQFYILVKNEPSPLLKSGVLAYRWHALADIQISLKRWVFGRQHYKKPIISLMFLILLFQIIFLWSLSQAALLSRLDNIGRYAMGMFLFSIIYAAEQKQKYSPLLATISILTTIIYFLGLIFVFPPQYFTT